MADACWPFENAYHSIPSAIPPPSETATSRQQQLQMARGCDDDPFNLISFVDTHKAYRFCEANKCYYTVFSSFCCGSHRPKKDNSYGMLKNQ